MQLVCLSDTHGRHRAAQVPDGDVLIHVGDISNGSMEEVRDFLAWFAQQPHPHKIFLAGNMDYPLSRQKEEVLNLLAPEMHYLENDSLELGGKLFWGSPFVPQFVGVFNLPRGEPLRRIWANIPDEVDILLTHTPPYGTLDRTSRGSRVGCEALAARLEDLSPAVHLFGHVHESYGMLETNGTIYANVSFLAGGYRGYNEPVVIRLDR